VRNIPIQLIHRGVVLFILGVSKSWINVSIFDQRLFLLVRV
jgi:hypothetical protein